MSDPAKLIGVSGALSGQSFLVGTSPLSIGRDSACSISVPTDPSLSRNHAQVYASGGVVFVADLGSSNGTRVNGQPITVPTQLMVGDLLTFGAQAFRFEGMVPPFPTGAPGTLQDALRQVPDFATRYQMVHNDMKRNPGRYWLPTLIGTVVLFVAAYWVMSSAFSGFPMGSDTTKTIQLRETLKVGMTMDEVRDIAGNPDSKSVSDGPIGRTEMWTYNGMSVFVHFGPSGTVQAINSSE